MIYFYLYLSFFLISVSLFFIIFINFSLWFVLVQNFISFMMLFLISFYLKSIRFLFIRFGSFLFYYLLLEVLFEIFIFINYLFNVESLFFIMLVFKISSFPFLFYHKMFNILFLDLVVFRLLILLYFLLFKVLILVFLFNMPIQIVSLLFYIIISSSYFILYFNFSSNSFICNSFIFSNTFFILTGLFFNYHFIIFYIIFISIFQYKILGMFYTSKYGVCFNNSCFFLMLLNGNPIFIFNWFKFFLYSVLLDMSFILFLVQVFLSSLFLSYSVYMFIYSKGYDFYSFKFINLLIIILFISLVSFLFLLYSNLFLYSYFIIFSSYQFVNLFPGTLSMDFFLIYGENIGVSVFLIIFILFMFFKRFSFSGVSFTSSILNPSYCISYFGLTFYFNYFDTIIFLVPYFLILVSTSNFIFLVEGINFLSMGEVMVLVFLLAYQWGWNVNLMLSDNFVLYLDLFYVTGFFNMNVDIKLCYIVCFIHFLSSLIYSNLLDCFIYIFLISIFSNIVFKSILLPRRVVIFIQGLSLDVIHSLFIPGLSVKEDLVSDKVFSSFINVLDLDSFNLEFNCFEYCGDFHHSMSGRFYILDFNVFSLILKKNER